MKNKDSIKKKDRIIFPQICKEFLFHPIKILKYIKKYRLVKRFGQLDSEYNIFHGNLPKTDINEINLHHLLTIKLDYRTIKKSGQFDFSFYKGYKDSPKDKNQAIIHYLKQGYMQGYNPNEKFDTNHYLNENADVKEDGINPFIHYLKYGMYEMRAFPEKNGLNEKSKIVMAFHYYRFNGFVKTVKRIINYRRKYKNYSFRQWTRLYGISKGEYKRQKSYTFSYKPLISILVPAYNTKPEFITDLLHSVKSQTYSNWELCIADGSTESVVNKYIEANQSAKIKYKRLEENKGITGNTLEAYKMAEGDYIVFLDHDDFLAPEALFEVVKAINDNPGTDFIFSDRAIVDEKKTRMLWLHFFPGYSPDLLRSYNYTSHISVFSKRIIDEVGFEREGFEGAQDYDLELRVIEKTDRVLHIPRILYYCRAHKDSISGGGEAKPYAYEAGARALEEHTVRIGYPANAIFLPETRSYKLNYEIKGNPSVAIIIPNKDHSDVLKRCIASILDKSTYGNYRIYIIENNSEDQETFVTYSKLKENARVSVMNYSEKGFNYSAIHNRTVEKLGEDYLLMLNNDTEVITESWIEEMLMFAQRDDVGAVGCMLYYPDNRIQHCGLEIGLNGWVASHYEHLKPRGSYGYINRLKYVQNYTGLTAACLMVSREDYLSVGGMDQENLKVALNDMDLCLRLIDSGKLNVFTPHAELYHYEGVTRGSDLTAGNKDRYLKEAEFFKNKWFEYFEKPDRYSNPNLSKYIY
ncbi:MAG: glycosyltransferase family 2 protein [Clostridia bacterium]|nr:glycosyltransferase family 2 protein [Clostridia bacterium]MBN2883542.1 glycosyltransferase family 2 protein [Clostridia bacterium]